MLTRIDKMYNNNKQEELLYLNQIDTIITNHLRMFTLF
jgi:hypothetical protein